VSSFRERNDRRPRFSPRLDAEGKPRRDRRGSAPASAGADWIWGRHAVAAAVLNPARAPLKRLVATPDALKALTQDPAVRSALAAAGLTPETGDAGEVARLLPQGAVHQGLALAAAPLEPLSLEEAADPAEGLILMLDQVTDPQNVGAIFRSAAAFGARAVVLQDRHAPAFSGALAKAAAGALERVPAVRVVNLARALDQLADLGWRTVGLAGEAEAPLSAVLAPGPTVLVLGSEGEGLRRLVGEHCEVLARIPMPGGFESLNVSAAAAIALYEARGRGSAPPEGEPS
jgi:23S rRNA (guanosine2251-2'-O)-methyltransferase